MVLGVFRRFRGEGTLGVGGCLRGAVRQGGVGNGKLFWRRILCIN